MWLTWGHATSCNETACYHAMQAIATSAESPKITLLESSWRCWEGPPCLVPKAHTNPSSSRVWVFLGLVYQAPSVVPGLNSPKLLWSRVVATNKKRRALKKTFKGSISSRYRNCHRPTANQMPHWRLCSGAEHLKEDFLSRFWLAKINFGILQWSRGLQQNRTKYYVWWWTRSQRCLAVPFLTIYIAWPSDSLGRFLPGRKWHQHPLPHPQSLGWRFFIESIPRKSSEPTRLKTKHVHGTFQPQILWVLGCPTRKALRSGFKYCFLGKGEQWTSSSLSRWLPNAASLDSLRILDLTFI